MPIKFRFRWIPFIATAIAVAIGISLAQWQTRRAVDKGAIEARLTARESAPPIILGSAVANVDEIEYRRALVKGEFVRNWPIYLENRPHNGIPGFYVMMPFKIAGSDKHVLITRGWVPRNVADRTKLPPIPTPEGIVEVQGVVVRNPGRVMQLGEAEALRPNAIVQNLDIPAFAAASKLSMQPFVIEQLGNTQDRLVRDWPRPSTGIEKHRGYAFQWYALAATAFLFFVVTGFRRETK
jgi:surfeit locus 1 family protein